MKDRDFYEESGGGVTLSGGEVFMQPEGLKSLLKKLKAQGLHVALETTGSYAPAMLREVVDDVDLFLMDLKHLDAGKLNDITGGNGELVVANFRYLAKNHPEKIVIRMPVIPGFNDESETIEAVLDFAASNHIQEVDLLPFHPLGASKWKNLGRPYAYEKEKMMEKQKLEPYIETGGWAADAKRPAIDAHPGDDRARRVRFRQGNHGTLRRVQIERDARLDRT